MLHANSQLASSMSENEDFFNKHPKSREIALKLLRACKDEIKNCFDNKEKRGACEPMLYCVGEKLCPDVTKTFKICMNLVKTQDKSKLTEQQKIECRNALKEYDQCTRQALLPPPSEQL